MRQFQTMVVIGLGLALIALAGLAASACPAPVLAGAFPAAHHAPPPVGLPSPSPVLEAGIWDGSALAATSTPTSTPGPVLIQTEAEDLPRQWPMITGYADDASACEYVYSPIQSSGLITFTFDLPLDTFYRLWGRAMGLSQQQDSLSYSLDGEDWVDWPIPQTDEGEWGWIWKTVGVPVRLGPGSHTLVFRGREHDSRLDRLEVASDVSYVPVEVEPCDEPTWTPTPTQTGTHTPTPTLTPTPPIQWFLEAESGGLTWPMVSHRDEDASACYYVSSDTREAGQVSFGFETTVADVYFVIARGMGLDWSQNSFWVSVDGGTENLWEVEPDNGTWTWVWDQVLTVPLNPGLHVLTFRAREQGTRLDRVELATRPDLEHSIEPCGATTTPTATASPTRTRPPTPTVTPTPTRTPTATSTRIWTWKGFFPFALSRHSPL